MAELIQRIKKKEMNNQPDSSLHSDKVHAGFLVERIKLIGLSYLDRQTVGVIVSSITALGGLTSFRILNNVQ